MQSLVIGATLVLIVLVGVARALRVRGRSSRSGADPGREPEGWWVEDRAEDLERRWHETTGQRPDTPAQRERDRAHRRAQRRPPEQVARKGETYELVVLETQYDRVPHEVRGTIDGLQTFVREVPDPDGPDALRVGDVVRVQVTDYGAGRTSAQARFLGRQ